MRGEGTHTRTLKPIPEFRDKYFIDKEGRIYRRHIKLLRLQSGIKRRVQFKELMPQLGTNNCLIVSLSIDGKPHTRSIKKLFKESFPALSPPIRTA